MTSFAKFLITAGLVALTNLSYSVVLSYYRFEVNNGSGTNLITPDEMGGNPMTSATAVIDSSANPGSLPNTFVPGTGTSNTSSLDGDPLDIDATVAYESKLDVDEMTIELFTRTEESIAVIAGRSSSSSIIDSISDGFRIYDPQSLSVDYYTWDGIGGATLRTINTGAMLDPDGTANGVVDWVHLAFSYEKSTGIGTVYLDGVALDTFDGPDGHSLYWGNDPTVTQPELQVGVEMDGFDFSKTEADNGYIDELRISNTAIPPEDLLNVPEPQHFSLFAGMGALCFLMLQRKRALPNRSGKAL